MNHITLLKHLQEALIRIKNLIADLAANTLGAIEDIEDTVSQNNTQILQRISVVENKISSVSGDNTNVTLTSTGWVGNAKPYTQTVSVNGVIANESKQNVFVSVNPVENDIDTTMDCAIYCTAQGNGTLTFTAFDDKPNASVTFNVIIQNI